MSNIVPFQEMDQMADAIAKSKLFGLQTKEQVLALMAIAQAEGLHPAMAARDYHIIQGRPALKADAMLARFQAAGGKVDWKEYTDKIVTGVFTHPNGGSITLSWTIDQARSIGLIKGGSGWEKYPRAMLRARVISEGIRTVFPGCVVGTYTPEEIQDFDPPPTKEIDVTPPPVESVTVTVNAIDALDNLESDTDALLIPLYIPGTEKPYGAYGTASEWIKVYTDLYRKIWESPKYSKEDKSSKLDGLRDANITIINKLSAMERIEITSTIAKIRGE